MTGRLQPLREPVNTDRPTPPIGPGVTIGHVHLKVADLDRALAFYCGVLGFEADKALTAGPGPPQKPLSEEP